jgi:hypothetical protein
LNGNKNPRVGIAVTVKALWIAMGLTPIILFVVTQLLIDSKAVEPGAEGSMLSFADPLFLLFSLAAIALFFSAQKVPAWINRKSSSRIDREPDQQQSFLIFVTSLALFEAIAVLGFTLSIIRSSPMSYLPFFFISLAGFLSFSPSRVFRRQERRDL